MELKTPLNTASEVAQNIAQPVQSVQGTETTSKPKTAPRPIVGEFVAVETK